MHLGKYRIHCRKCHMHLPKCHIHFLRCCHPLKPLKKFFMTPKSYTRKKTIISRSKRTFPLENSTHFLAFKKGDTPLSILRVVPWCPLYHYRGAPLLRWLHVSHYRRAPFLLRKKGDLLHQILWANSLILG